MNRKCDGSNQALKQSEYSKNQAVCSVCTKHLKGKIGQKAPNHSRVILKWRY